MKKISFLMVALLATLSFGVNAAEVAGCTGSQTAAVTGAEPFGASGEPTNGTFVKTGFRIGCSAKVSLQYSEVSANEFTVASGSLKGNQTYKGNSGAGGTIVPHASCDASAGCRSGTEVAAALTAAADLDASSN